MNEIMRPEKSDEMSHLELSDLSRNETIINKGMKSFVDVGQALQDIRHRRLWRGEYNSFESYLKDKWGFGSPYATRLINGSEIAQRLPDIQNEAQAREIAKVPFIDQEKVLNRAKDYAVQDERPMWAKDIRVASCEPSSVTARPDTEEDLTNMENISTLWGDIEEMLKDLKEMFRRLSITPEGCWIKPHIDTIESRLKDCSRIADGSKPHAPCPECSGGLKVECNACRNRGWLPKDRHDILMKIKDEKRIADTLTAKRTDV